jgi:hypothetical protein
LLSSTSELPHQYHHHDDMITSDTWLVNRSTWWYPQEPLSMFPPTFFPLDFFQRHDENDNGIFSTCVITRRRPNYRLWIDSFWPLTRSKSSRQPRSMLVFHHILTVGSASAVECVRMPPKPLLG